MIQFPLVFKTSRWVLGIVAAGLAICVAGTLHFSRQPGAELEVVALTGLTLLFAVGLVEGLTARVELNLETLEVVTNFRRRAIPRAEVIRAVGEKGVPVAIELRSGGWLKLPRLGTGPHANTVRAWIKRSAAADREVGA